MLITSTIDPEVLDPHFNSPLLFAGTPIERADCAIILLHGRNASADDILALADAIDPLIPGRRLAWLAPEAADNTWYPNSFLAPLDSNQPWLSSALNRVAATLAIATEYVPTTQVIFCGFSQGACLATQFVVSHPAEYAGLIAFTGGLIGPPDTPFRFPGQLPNLPALLLTGDPDPHVPYTRVQQSAETLTAMGATVTLRRFPGRPHTISAPELDLARTLIEHAFAPKP
jgi:predicted esterase